jgi:hypothetical protein
MPRREALAAALWLWLGAGCTSLTSLTRARTLPPGQTEVGLDLKGPFPLAELVVRRGMTDWLELGGRVGGFYSVPVDSLSAMAEAKLQLRRSPEVDHGWDLALTSGMGYQSLSYGGSTAQSAHLSGALLLGWNLGHGHQLVAGPRAVQAWLWDPNAQTVSTLAYGLSLGVAFQLPRGLQLMPEGALLYTRSTFNTAQGEWEPQLGLGLLFQP